MSDLLDEKEIIKLERFLKREGREDFVTEMMAAGPAQLDAKLLGLAKHLEEIQNTQNKDDVLKKAKANATALGSQYRDQRKMNKKLTRFVALLMEEKGVALSK